MKSISTLTKEKPWLGWVLFLVTMGIVFLLGLLASSIIERRAEAEFAFIPQVRYAENEPRNSIWGMNFPMEYQSYQQTADTSFRSRYNGSATIDVLEEHPEMVVLWAGYGFSKDYTQARGHHYSIRDIRQTLRTGAPSEDNPSPMPNTCWTCKSPDVPRLMNETGVAEFYRGSWETRGHQVVNSIGCADCHDAETMELRISRPALLEAFEAMGKDISKASHQEMRSLVCAQCHAEYYFDKNIVEGVQYLVFPWKNGLLAEDMEAYYDELGFSDWIHQISRAPMIKAQHPGYEIYTTGVHASRGISCADCHMPFMSEGGQKYTDHHVQSPLNNIANSCQVCHREESERLVQDVYARQDRIHANRRVLEELLVRSHVEAGLAWDLGAGPEQMEGILTDIRHAQWRWDYAVAGHGSSFHSPLETLRVITTAITIAQEARIKLSRVLYSLGYEEEVPYPDIASKADAQEFIGLDMKKLHAEKGEFLRTVVPVWETLAAEREATYPVKSLFGD
jgi:nitrite reductase (cytochrome c-552)